MVTTLAQLIDKQDGFEVIRDQIALLIFDNQAAQQVLATAGGKDPALWKLRVYTERANPWEQFTNAPADPAPDVSPIVHVWFDSGTFDRGASDTVHRQLHEATFNVDVYGWGIAADDGATGHLPGDREAAYTAQRGARLVRNILMAGENTYLQRRAKDFPPPAVAVGSRWIQSLTSFQPEFAGEPAHAIVGARLTLRVELTEYGPQFLAADNLDFIAVDINRAGDGLLVAEVDFDLTV